MATLISASCVDRPNLPLAPPDEVLSEEALTALSWVGSYEGWGNVTMSGETVVAHDITMRITLDADSVESPECKSCVTIVVDPWFSMVNARMPLSVEAFLSYSVDSVSHTMSVFRFSGRGETANALLVTIRHEQPGPSGTQTLFNAELEFRLR
jgi:hypothetical protein